MNYNKEDYHSKDKRILAGDVAQELNVVVGEIGWWSYNERRIC